MSEFKAGEVVELKSGGPLMTVERVTEDGYVNCVWFNERLEVCLAYFPPATLRFKRGDG